MARKKKEQKVPAQVTSLYENARILSEYNKVLETDATYSLEVDPDGKYNMTEFDKSFVRYYLEYRNLPLVAEMLGIDKDETFAIFKKYEVQQEIKRINRGLYLRQFEHKMLSIPQLAGYLSSLITDENVPEADRLKTSEKVNVAKYLIDLNINAANYMKDPSQVMTQTFETKVKELSVEAIKQLVDASDNLDKKKELIDKLNVDNTLTLEDMSFLETLSVDELLALLGKIEGDEHGKS